MNWGVVILEAMVCLFSYSIADYMVTHRIGLAKNMLIGQDTREDKLKMLKLAVALYRGENHENIELKKYTISATLENHIITETTVETEKTILTYTEKEGERFINKGLTENGATIFITFFLLLFMTIILAISAMFFS